MGWPTQLSACGPHNFQSPSVWFCSHTNPFLAATSKAFLDLLSALKTTRRPWQATPSSTSWPRVRSSPCGHGAYQSLREAHSLITIPRGDSRVTREPMWH